MWQWCDRIFHNNNCLCFILDLSCLAYQDPVHLCSHSLHPCFSSAWFPALHTCSSYRPVSYSIWEAHTVEEWQVPASRKWLQQVWGLAGFYWRFIRDYNEVASRLTKSVNVMFRWTEEAHMTFLKLKICSPLHQSSHTLTPVNSLSCRLLQLILVSELCCHSMWVLIITCILVSFCLIVW